MVRENIKPVNLLFNTLISET